MEFLDVQELLSTVATVDELLALNELLEIHNHVATLPSLLPTNNLIMANRYNNEVINTHVGQDELAALQCELFAAAREALASARESGTIPASLITSCHMIVKDAGMKPDTAGVGQDDDAHEAARLGFSPNWLRESAEVLMDIEDLDVN